MKTKTVWTPVRLRRPNTPPPAVATLIVAPAPRTTPRHASSDAGWLDEPYGLGACLGEVML